MLVYVFSCGFTRLSRPGFPRIHRQQWKNDAKQFPGDVLRYGLTAVRIWAGSAPARILAVRMNETSEKRNHPVNRPCHSSGIARPRDSYLLEWTNSPHAPAPGMPVHRNGVITEDEVLAMAFHCLNCCKNKKAQNLEDAGDFWDPCIVTREAPPTLVASIGMLSTMLCACRAFLDVYVAYVCCGIFSYRQLAKH